MSKLFYRGTPMDWDELLFDIPLVGLDFEIVIRIGDLQLFRGPMGSVHRVGDEVFFRPVWVGLRKKKSMPRVVDSGDGLKSPNVHLLRSQPQRLQDHSILIVASDTPWFLIHAPGNNITLSELFGHEVLA